MKLDQIKFSGGLIPAIIQDVENNEILMLAYMNQESLEKTIQTGETHFFSRSQGKLWKKGETSGHIQKVKAIHIDCDSDTLLIKVEQVGVACHTGERSCFFKPLARRGTASRVPLSTTKSPSSDKVFDTLYKTISDRKIHRSAQSYTSTLFQGGLDLILKKVGEEAGEFIISAKNKRKPAIVHETADLLYHLLVALNFHKIPMAAIEGELTRRMAQSGLSEKASRRVK